MTINTDNLAELFSENFSHGSIEGKKWRDTRYAGVELSGAMYVGSGDVFAQNRWKFKKIGFTIPQFYRIVAEFPEIGIVSNGQDYALLSDVPLKTMMMFYTYEKLTFNTPAMISLTAAGGHDFVKMKAYLGNKQVGDEMIPPLNGVRKEFDIAINARKGMGERLSERLGFVVQGKGLRSVGVISALYDVKLLGLK